MIKILVSAVALTISLAGYAIAQEAAPRHHHHHRQSQPGPSPGLQPGPSPEAPDVFWTPAGGNPVHYGQTSGFYAGR